MHLKYTIHSDDYHSTIEAHGVRSERFAVLTVRAELTAGYDVTNVTLDGKPFDLTPFCVEEIKVGDYAGQQCPNRAEAGTQLCITHRHFHEYQNDRYAYKGD